MKKALIIVLSVLMLASCSKGTTIATVGTEKISEGEFKFYLSSIKSQLEGTELQTDEDWQNQEIEGKKAIDVAKERALEIAVNNIEYCEIAQKLEMNLTEEEETRVTETKERLISRYGGKKEYKKYLKENNITDEFIDMMCKSPIYYNKLAQKVISENPISDVDAVKYYESRREELEATYRKAKHILLLTQDPNTGVEKSAEEVEKAKALATELLERVSSGEDFDKLMKEYSEDPGLEANPNGYVFTSGEMVSEFEQATDSINPGDYVICKSSYGYHVIKREPVYYNDMEGKIKDELTKKKIEEQVKAWEKDLKIKVTSDDKMIKTIE